MCQRQTVIMEEINVDYCGEIWNGNDKYEMIIISKFDNNDKEELRKVFYLDRWYQFNLEQARYLLNNFPNCSKLKILNTIMVKV